MLTRCMIITQMSKVSDLSCLAHVKQNCYDVFMQRPFLHFLQKGVRKSLVGVKRRFCIVILKGFPDFTPHTRGF